MREKELYNSVQRKKEEREERERKEKERIRLQPYWLLQQ